MLCICLILSLFSTVWAEESEMTDRCLSFEQNENSQMHEYGSTRVVVKLQVSGNCVAGKEAPLHSLLIVIELDGIKIEALSRNVQLGNQTATRSIELLLPMQMSPGPHELLAILQSLDGQEIDSAVYNFFTADWQPAVDWIFPPEDFVFKRNAQKFVRFRIIDKGDGKRCQVQKMSCVPPCSYFLHTRIVL